MKVFRELYLFIIAIIFIITIAILRQPSLRSHFVPSYRTELWQALIAESHAKHQIPTPDLWQFREFFSRGQIRLAKNEKLEISKEIQDAFVFPPSYQPYLTFSSDKIQSVEGTVEQNRENTFFGLWKPDEMDPLYGCAYFCCSDGLIGISKDKKTGYIIKLSTIEEAARANGYLYFELRNKEYADAVQHKNWATVSVVRLD